MTTGFTRDAKLYLLDGKDWQPLANKVKDDYKTSKDISMYYSEGKESKVYAVLSMTEQSDKIAEDFGCYELSKNNTLRCVLHEKELLYGDKSNLDYLPKVGDI